jgi:hypothetical protein
MTIFWPNKISNKDLHNITNTKDMETLLIQKRWKWLGHVLRKPSEDMTKVSLRWTPEGKRKRGRPKTTWRRTIENEIKESGYTWGTKERGAQIVHSCYKVYAWSSLKRLLSSRCCLI